MHGDQANRRSMRSVIRDVDGSRDPGFALLSFPGQSAVLSQPNEGALEDLTLRKNVKSGEVVGTLDSFCYPAPEPLPQVRPAVATVDPNFPQSGEPFRKGFQFDRGTDPW